MFGPNFFLMLLMVGGVINTMSTLTFGAALDLCGRVRTVDAARMFFDLV